MSGEIGDQRDLRLHPAEDHRIHGIHVGDEPRGIDYDEVSAALVALPGVARLHDLHIWPMSTTEPVLTAHLLIPAGHPGDGFLDDAQAMLRERFGIGHATLQVETGTDCGTGC